VAAAAKAAPQPKPAPLTEEDMFNTVEFNITGKYRLEAIAKKLDMELAELSRLNPDFAKTMAGPDNSYDLRVPSDKMKQFMHEKDEILKASVQMTLDEKNTAADKSRFPPPARLPAKKEDTKARKDSSITTGKAAARAKTTTARAQTPVVAKKK